MNKEQREEFIKEELRQIEIKIARTQNDIQKFKQDYEGKLNSLEEELRVLEFRKEVLKKYKS